MADPSRSARRRPAVDRVALLVTRMNLIDIAHTDDDALEKTGPGRLSSHCAAAHRESCVGCCSAVCFTWPLNELPVQKLPMKEVFMNRSYDHLWD